MSFTAYREVEKSILTDDSLCSEESEKSEVIKTVRKMSPPTAKVEDQPTSLEHVMQENEQIRCENAQLRSEIKKLKKLLEKSLIAPSTSRVPSSAQPTAPPDVSSDDESSASYVDAGQLLADTNSGIKLLHLISEFDGKNRTVERFLADVKTVLNNFKIEETIFVPLVITNKIKGDAKDLVDGLNVRSYNKLREVLLLEYGLSKSRDLLTLERQHLRQNGRNIREFTRRYNLLHRDIIRSIQAKGYTANEANVLIKSEEENSLITYIRNLDQPIQGHVRNQRPCTLREAQQIAYELHREEELQQHIHKYRPSNRSFEKARTTTLTSHATEPRSAGRPSGGNKVTAEKPSGISRNPVCYRCNKEGHYSKECPSANFRKPSEPTSPNIKFVESIETYEEDPNPEILSKEWQSDFEDDCVQELI